MSMEDLFPPLVNKPNPMDDPAAPAFGRRGYVEPYEAEDDPDFSYDGFQVTRREYYAHNNEPAISFSDGRLGINAVCLKKAPDVEYVQILVNREKKKLVIRPCTEDDWDSFMWCTRSHKSKSITCRMADLSDQQIRAVARDIPRIPRFRLEREHNIDSVRTVRRPMPSPAQAAKPATDMTATTVKDMPNYDPDAQVASLTLTMSGCRQQSRSRPSAC